MYQIYDEIINPIKVLFVYFRPYKSFQVIRLNPYLHNMKILLLESFYTSSHKHWVDGLISNSKHTIHLLSLPGRHWKWRMHHAGLHFAQKVVELDIEYDIILCSDLMNVAEFRGLLHKNGHHNSWYNTIPIGTYFHENQITYPWSDTDPDVRLKRDNHYGWINYMTCESSDFTLFNSKYHLDIFYGSLPKFLGQFPGTKIRKSRVDQLKKSAKFLPIGLHINELIVKDKPSNTSPVILWNHRWEYDKNPTLFFETLFDLKAKGIPFQLIILGEKYKAYPSIFDKASNLLKDEIIHFGFAESREMYLELLLKADIVPVTSNQDFFGISAVEAIAAGAIPILPNRLAFPEHLDFEKFKKYYYNTDQEFYSILKKMITSFPQRDEGARNYISKYDWENVVNLYDDYFEKL